MIDAATYAIERAICDKARAYSESFGRNWMSAEDAAHPDYAPCNNDMRGRVEQYEIKTNPPERLTAYICTQMANGRYPVATWTGHVVGTALQGSRWRVHSYIGSHLAVFYARIAGRDYVGRGFGEGVCINLRETAASKKNRESV